MANLLLHCGSRRVDREQIMLAPTPPRTNTWVPVPHQRLLQQVEHTLLGCGMTVVNEAHGLWALGPESIGSRALATVEAPNLTLPTLDGETFELRSLLGKKVVLVAWSPY